MIVKGAGVDIATEDRGGDGPTMLLTHGMGGEQGHLGPLVRRLGSRYRIVTFDMRNHGASGDGDWTWPLVCEDIAAVRHHYRLDRPIVGGHSLGGMVGVLFAEAVGGVRGVVNIDGHGMGRPEQYVGMTADEVAEAITRLRATEATLSADPRPAIAAMTPVVQELYMFDHYANVRCPQLIFNACGPDPMGNVEGLEWIPPIMAAYRAGLGRDLAVLAAEYPSIEIATLPDAAHYLIFTHADAVAERIHEFATRLN